MNRHFAFALVIATAAAGNAFADDITVDPAPFSSSLSRAQVQDQLQQFRQSGVDPWSQSHDVLAGLRGERTRAELSAEYIAGRDQVAALNGEDSGSVYLARLDLPQSGAQVASLAE